MGKRYRGRALPDDPEEQNRVLASLSGAAPGRAGRDQPATRMKPQAASSAPAELRAVDRAARTRRVTVTEDQLIATPFVFEFTDELLAELSR